MIHSLDELLEASRRSLARLEQPQRRFEIIAALADNYDELLASDYGDRDVELEKLLEVTRQAGRLVLAAPAASGKTSLASRLAEVSVERRQPAVWIDLRRWTYELNERWRAARDSDTARMNLLLSHLAMPNVDEAQLAVAAGAGCLIVVDGLNEIPRSAGTQIPWVLDTFAARRPFASIVMCDRLQRRALPSDDWALATITEVRDPARAGVVSHNALMLDLSDDTLATSSGEARLLLTSVAQAIDGLASVDEVAAAAFDTYSKRATLYFPLAELADRIPRPAVDRLIDSGTLIVEGDHGYYRHHLFHDALAAHHVVADERLWNGRTFDLLTFKAASFDAVALALELLEDSARGDRFLVEVYNWNQYGAAYALSRGRRFATISVSEGLELAMLAMLAERRWDPVAPTAQRCADALRVFPGVLAKRLLAAANPEEVRRLIAEQATTDASMGWLATFLRQADVSILISQMQCDKLTGWMAANALRDVPSDDRLLDRLLQATESRDRDVRWRAAHALGAHATRRTADRLLKLVVSDPDEWVRYGAIRSVIEQAGRSEGKLRRRILEQVRRRLNSIRSNSLVTGELEKALQLSQPPIGWASDVEPLITELFATSITVADQDHWRRVGQRVTDAVRAARAVPA